MGTGNHILHAHELELTACCCWQTGSSPLKRLGEAGERQPGTAAAPFTTCQQVTHLSEGPQPATPAAPLSACQQLGPPASHSCSCCPWSAAQSCQPGSAVHGRRQHSASGLAGSLPAGGAVQPQMLRLDHPAHETWCVPETPWRCPWSMCWQQHHRGRNAVRVACLTYGWGQWWGPCFAAETAPLDQC